jgi:hypothetical protein
MKSKQVPEILYKYRAFTDRAVLMLKNNQLYFASPLEFNDPFDCVAQENIYSDKPEISFYMCTYNKSQNDNHDIDFFRINY